MIQAKTRQGIHNIHLGIAATTTLQAIRLKDVHMLIPRVLSILKLVKEDNNKINELR
jgi:hypothetical protein